MPSHVDAKSRRGMARGPRRLRLSYVKGMQPGRLELERQGDERAGVLPFWEHSVIGGNSIGKNWANSSCRASSGVPRTAEYRSKRSIFVRAKKIEGLCGPAWPSLSRRLGSTRPVIEILKSPSATIDHEEISRLNCGHALDWIGNEPQAARWPDV